ncbi:methyltransferase domain-containing protein [Qipengyuania sp. 1NDH17]|uniref:Methyltransferase domain-containing protein n=1 Tax=Qipengyuania polymorpha TaxID=2867234 RepID=A0ABS7IZQ2_9SPHN|nr:methyltransferase domain-containing protein [Qipengyuania polymorpha]MBX7459047.1 methyltransferase domain-containing protein [Qipengyuania polymorpha]
MLGRLIWRAKQAVHTLRNATRPEKRSCPICQYEGLFGPFGFPVRPEAQCPKCKSLERHRQLALWLERDGNKARFAGKRLLHFAPEKAIETLLRPHVESYVTADLEPGVAELVINIEQIDMADKSVGVIVCSHVLEHVDDAKALRELERILTDDGFALLMVPMVHHWEKSFERPAPTVAERIKYFGQFDHIRRYGRDFVERVKDAGFAVEAYSPTPEECIEYGLGLGAVMYVAEPQRG